MLTFDFNNISVNAKISTNKEQPFRQIQNRFFAAKTTAFKNKPNLRNIHWSKPSDNNSKTPLFL